MIETMFVVTTLLLLGALIAAACSMPLLSTGLMIIASVGVFAIMAMA